MKITTFAKVTAKLAWGELVPKFRICNYINKYLKSDTYIKKLNSLAIGTTSSSKKKKKIVRAT